jgi:hypothetical protein
VIPQHLDAIEAQLRLALAQVEAMRHHIVTQAPVKAATVALPERCVGVPAEQCGMQDEDARQDIATFSASHRWRCVGCRHEEG